jgi:hypothetical protein
MSTRLLKKSLKIPKGLSESVNQATPWPKEKVQKTIYKTLHRKLKIEQYKPNEKPEVTWVLRNS